MADQCHPRADSLLRLPRTGGQAITSARSAPRLWRIGPIGYAVVSGTIGDEAQFPSSQSFAAMSHAAQRIVVVGLQRTTARLMERPMVVGQSLRIPIGRDVVIDVSNFEMTGRGISGLRQALHPQFRPDRR